MNFKNIDQVAFFKLGAAARYKELGIPPKVANDLFLYYLNKLNNAANVAQLLQARIPLKKAANILKKAVCK